MGKIREALRAANRHELAAQNPIYREIKARREHMDVYDDPTLIEHYHNTASTVRQLAERILRKREAA